MRWIGTRAAWADDGDYVGMLYPMWITPTRHVLAWFWTTSLHPVWVFEADLDDARCMVEQLIWEAE